MENGANIISDETRARITAVSAALLRLHKSLLDSERFVYESVHGQVASPYEMLRIVMNDTQFAWLRKLSSLIALLDEAVAARTPPLEAGALALLEEARTLLKFETQDKTFVESFQRGLKRSPEAKANYDEVLKVTG